MFETMPPTRNNRFRTALALAALAALLWGAFLWPLPAHPFSGIPFTAWRGAAPHELVQGDHLQLQYHFDLVHEMLRGRIRAFSNPYEFNLDDRPAPRRPDPFYFPFALPYGLLRFVLPDAACWNLAQWLSVFLGLLFCHRLARRFGAGNGAALAIAALSTCFPYRWTVLAGGSPTGFGMGLVPGVALGADLAVRDRSVRGGALAGALLFCLYAADLHCFLFAALSLPFWGVLALLRSERGLRRPAGLAAALAPVALGGALAAALGFFARRGYEGTDVAGGRTMWEIQVNSPRIGAMLDPFHPGYASEAFYAGPVFPALCALALAAILAAAARRRDRAAADRVLAGLLLALGVAGATLLALGYNGPWEALPLRVVRKLVPPFRMVRQPVKVYCLAPTLLAAFFALAWSLRPRLRFSKGTLAPAVSVVLLAFLFSHRGMRAGICLEPGRAHPAWEAAAADAKAHGAAPRAIVLPIWPGDSSWSSVYQYHAVRAGVPMLNGYAAVRTLDYAENVFHRFETMTEGDLTEDQLDGLRAMGVTHAILHENAFPAKVSHLPFAETLRRHLADPRLRLVAGGDGVWTFALPGRDGGDGAASVPAAPPPPFAATARHWRLDLPGTNAAVRLRSFAGIHREGFGWLVRAEAGKPLVLATEAPGGGAAATNVFAAVPGAAPGSWRLAWVPAPFPETDLWTTLATPGGARISDVAVAPAGAWGEPATNRFCMIPAAALSHDFGRTDAGGAGLLRFEPGREPDCVAPEGPRLPLPLPPGRYRASVAADAAPETFRLEAGAGLGATPAADDPRAVEFDYDGTAFATFRVHWDGSRPAALRAIRVEPVSAADAAPEPR